MSKSSRSESAAKAMTEAGQDAAILIEACENKHRLTSAEAMDVLCCCVCSFLARDGENDPQTMKKRLIKFGEHLTDYMTDVFGVKWEEDVSDQTGKAN